MKQFVQNISDRLLGQIPEDNRYPSRSEADRQRDGAWADTVLADAKAARLAEAYGDGSKACIITTDELLATRGIVFGADLELSVRNYE